MSKMLFELPLVLTAKGGGMGGGGDAGDEGQGSGQGSLDPVSWSVWLEMYGNNGSGFDLDHDGDVDQYDYYLWWIANGFTHAQWVEANGSSFPWYGN